MMKAKYKAFLKSFALSLLLCSNVIASKNTCQVFDAWHFFPSTGSKSQGASLQSVPTHPKDCKDVIRLVVSIFNDTASAELSFNYTESLNQKKPPILKVGDKTYPFKIIDGQMAWPEEGDEKPLLDALKTAKEVDINVTTADNKIATFRFSLKGFSKALEALLQSKKSNQPSKDAPAPAVKKASQKAQKNTTSKDKKA